MGAIGSDSGAFSIFGGAGGIEDVAGTIPLFIISNSIAITSYFEG